MSTIIQGAKPTKPAEAQLESLRQMVKILDLVYGIEVVGGHRDFAVPGHETDCPGNIAYPILIQQGIITR